MPKLRPIKAITYVPDNQENTTIDISSKIAPPYDVLDEEPKQNLLNKDPHNIVAVDLPVTPPKTVGPDSAYAKAGDTLNQWLKESVLTQDESPAIFAYEQEFTAQNKTHKRRGLFANLKVEEFNQGEGGIFRHEHTIKGGVDDRSKLMDATSCQLSPVFGTFSDSKSTVAGQLDDYFNNRLPGFTGTTSDDNVVHRVWRVNDKNIIDKLSNWFEDKDVFIADGHHRYTTALNYSKKHQEQSGSDNCLFVLVAQEDPGMIVLPYHRVITGLKNFTFDKLIDLVEKRDDITLIKSDQDEDDLEKLAKSLADSGKHAMGIYDPKSSKTYLLTTSVDPLSQKASDKPDVWRQLDVAILQHLIVEDLLAPQFGGDLVQCKYSAQVQEVKKIANNASDKENSALGIFMQYTPIESVCQVAKENEVMPPKSTYFFPKLATGLVINPLK